MPDELSTPPTAPEPRTRIARLAPGDQELRSRSVPQPLIPSLLALLASDARANVLGSHHEPTVVAFDCGDGRVLRIALTRAQICIDGVPDDGRRYDEEHGRWIEADELGGFDAADEAVDDVLRLLQRVTGWHADRDGFDSAGACLGCGLEVFESEESCPECGRPLDEDGEQPQDEERPAHAVVLARVAPPAEGLARSCHAGALPPHPTSLHAVLLLALPRAKPTAQPRIVRASGATIDFEVCLFEGGIEVRALSDEELETEDGEASAAMDRALEESTPVLRTLQQLTSWSVVGHEYWLGEGYDPVGGCLECGAECFRWQATCTGCRAALPPRPSLFTMVARRLLTALVDEELLELDEDADEDARADLEGVVARALRDDTSSSELARVIEREDIVADILLCDVDDLSTRLRAAVEHTIAAARRIDPILVLPLRGAWPLSAEHRTLFAAGVDPTLRPIVAPPLGAMSVPWIVVIGAYAGNLLLGLHALLVPGLPDEERWADAHAAEESYAHYWKAKLAGASSLSFFGLSWSLDSDAVLESALRAASRLVLLVDDSDPVGAYRTVIDAVRASPREIPTIVLGQDSALASWRSGAGETTALELPATADALPRLLSELSKT